MNAFFAVLFVIFFYIICYPFAKNLQLCGYDTKFYFVHMFKLPYDFSGKTNLVWTKRMIRLAIVYLLVLLAITLPYFILIFNFWWIALGVIIEFLLLPFIFVFTALVMHPCEAAIKKFYIKKACKVLQEFKGIKIAITGSFGKTSTKNFLAAFLKQKYKVCATPQNFNTPMGLCRTALECLKPDDEVLIIEMGARHEGDIAELMQMSQPQYGILTAIGEQHLQSFGSLEKIKKTKFELCEHMPKGGKVVFDCASEPTRELFEKFRGEKYLVGQKEGCCYIKDAKYSRRGSSFKLVIDGEEYKAKTKILGSALLSDIATAAYMAHLLGVDVKKIVETISGLSPTPHRLQLIENPFCTVIDDSYNCNLLGARQACECLKLFKGKKIVVSPGLVEQGDKQYEFNFKLGKMIACCCDEFIIMNETNKTALTKGALAGGMKKQNLHYAYSRKEQNQILKSLQEKSSVVLFENDLPDNFK